MPFMLRSLMTTAKSWSPNFERACSPEDATLTARPSSFRMSDRSAHISGSSSTTKTLLLAASIAPPENPVSQCRERCRNYQPRPVTRNQPLDNLHLAELIPGGQHRRTGDRAT